ncbi:MULTISPECIES: YicC/YloC family endoribonuclease [Bacillus]|uniref:YicC/YloC family endoribonuclease n=1 Tax=Bacillus TaxID=1386 RepID=UPI00083DBDB1|nr:MULTISPECIES: YicC/YloC family endoribonuclease [Bacillus]MDY7903633.1 YicC/YloC family endoribonuclease [Bacillus sp. AG1]ODB73406.1 YicC family protein [Bacillus velezensis]QBK22259.1 YicC family protein [Bacillus velezensis]QWK26814.1 YicC family protein [Bacillus velezensis]
MIRSMTGFGSASSTKGDLSATVELKSVNYRFKEVNARLPRPLLYVEDKLKQTILQHIQRGRVELFLTVNSDALIKRSLNIDWELLDEYVSAARAMKERYSLAAEPDAMDFFRFEHIAQIHEEQMRDDKLEEVIREAAELAVKELCDMREKEGRLLAEDCFLHIARLETLSEQVKERASAVVIQYRERLYARMKEWTEDALDESRLITECAIFADRSDITEEITRLKSHFVQFRDILKEGGAVGRKLDFLVQELNREANTIGSKANDHQITKLVVEMKSSIEKLKEQVQNIE